MIPGTMGTSSYVLHGTDVAMEETFGSTAHGAGRVLSRSKAKKDYNPDEIVELKSKQHLKMSLQKKHLVRIKMLIV